MGKAKTRAAILLIFVFLVPLSVSAQVEITEIMYDLPSGSDSGREWIEIHNTGSAPLDATELKLFEGGVNHKIVATKEENIPPGGYAIIAADPAKFRTDWPQFSGALFDSAFSLSNTGETLEIRNASSTVLHAVSYTSAGGANGDGNTINYTGTWIARKPSPGAPVAADAFVKAAPVPEVRAKEKTTKVSSPVDGEDDVEEAEGEVTADVATIMPAAAAGSYAGNRKWIWWSAALLLALTAAGSIVFARNFAKDEWDIVENEEK